MQGFVRPLTHGTSFLLSGRTDAFLLNEALLGSCEAATAATQWSCALLIVLYSVANEYKLRRTFLSRGEGPESPRSRKPFGDWPGGAPKGVVQCLTAFLIPVQCFNALWHLWLQLQERVVAVWEVGVPSGPSLLHMPYWVQ